MKSCPILLYFFPFCHYTSDLNLRIFSIISKHFSNHDVNIKEDKCVKSFKFNGFFTSILYPWFKSKLDFRKLSTWTISYFLNELIFLSQNEHFLPGSCIIIGGVESKSRCSDNPVHTILGFF